ncbi:MAG: DUF308 domain-containing protein [Thermomicrobiales bacterium]|nr:DUF308 domain-containing protein [Thermomicrobiales bacterium]
MQTFARGVGEQAPAIRPGQRWWLVLLEGIAGLVIGIVILAYPSNASDVIRLLIAIGLLVVSAGQIVDGFRSWGHRASPWSAFSGGVGLTASGLALLAGAVDQLRITDAGARQILALGLIAFGIIGLAALVFTIRSSGFRVVTLIVDAVAIALGLLLFTAQADDLRGTQLLGVVAIIGGVAFLIYGYILWSRPRAAR